MKIQHHFFSLILFLSYFITQIALADELIIEPDMGRTPLINAIQHAKSSIDLAVYGLTDRAFIQALINAKENKKNVTILLEQKPYKNEHENDFAINQLQRANINLQWPDQRFKLLHQKTFIFDGNKAIVMTFNLTHSSFASERNFALVITDPKTVKEIKKVFQADWSHEKITLSDSNLVWSPDNSRKQLNQLINSAKTEIKMYEQDVSDYQIIGTLAKAARSGVKIRILLSKASNPKKIEFLKRAGVVVHVSSDYYIHAKVIMIDQEAALLGSINLTTASINDNRELSVITHDRKVINQLNNTFENDWRSAKTVRNSTNPNLPPLKVLREIKHLWEMA